MLMTLDDTIERRRGAKIAAKGIYRDPVRSSHSHFVKASGLRWLCLMLVAPIAWDGRCWALPLCSVLAPSERYYLDRKRRSNKLTDPRHRSLSQSDMSAFIFGIRRRNIDINSEAKLGLILNQKSPSAFVIVAPCPNGGFSDSLTGSAPKPPAVTLI